MTAPREEAEKIEEIKERLKLATAGTWKADSVWMEEKFKGNSVVCEVMRTWLVLTDHPETRKQVGYDAEFIAHAREDILYLISTLSQRDQRIKELENEIKKLKSVNLLDSKDAYEAALEHRDQTIAQLEAERDKFKEDAAHREMEVFFWKQKVEQFDVLVEQLEAKLKVLEEKTLPEIASGINESQEKKISQLEAEVAELRQANSVANKLIAEAAEEAVKMLNAKNCLLRRCREAFKNMHRQHILVGACNICHIIANLDEAGIK